MKQLILLFTFLFAYIHNYGQDFYIQKVLGTNKIYLGQSIDSISFISAKGSKYEKIQYKLSPINIDYIATGIKLNDYFNSNSLYFNIDTSKKVSSIIIELINIDTLEINFSVN